MKIVVTFGAEGRRPWIFIYSGWCSQQFITKSQLTADRQVFCYDFQWFCQICISMICISMISVCISVFGFEQLTTTVKLVLLQSYGHQYLSVKTSNSHIVESGLTWDNFQPKRKIKKNFTLKCFLYFFGKKKFYYSGRNLTKQKLEKISFTLEWLLIKP